MPSLKKQVETGVYSALNVSSVTDLATGGVYLGVADDDADHPFVVFNWQAFSEVDYTFSFGQAVEQGLLLIQSYANENSDPTKTASGLNDEILEQCKTLLHAGISLGTGEVLYLRKYSDTPEIEESISGVALIRNGMLFKVISQ